MDQLIDGDLKILCEKDCGNTMLYVMFTIVPICVSPRK